MHLINYTYTAGLRTSGGFGWHHGWNDRVNTSHTDEYEVNLAHLIRDVRTDLNLPNLPFIIAGTGMDGWEMITPGP